MTELSLSDIKNYLEGSAGPVAGTTKCNVAVINATKTIIDADTFLLDAIKTATNSLNTSMTTKDNFLTLYNEQYSRNMETFAGILIVSSILAMIMVYPTQPNV